MQLNPEDLQRGIPAYLSAADKAALIKALADFPHSREVRPYFFNVKDQDPLQGDLWRGLEVLRYEDGARKRVLGMLISNSCDIAPGNERHFPPKLSFATLVSLDRYRQALLKNGLDQERIDAHIKQVRAQSVTSLFYLPAEDGLHEENIAVLQDLHSVPLKAFIDDSIKSRVATLSQLGFYLFLFKLSIHFCRFLEGVDRGSIAEQVAT
jgi:hypothetical protein